MQFLPPMTGNGKHSTYKNGDDWGMVCGIVLPTLLLLLNEWLHFGWLRRTPTDHTLSSALQVAWMRGDDVFYTCPSGNTGVEHETTRISIRSFYYNKVNMAYNIKRQHQVNIVTQLPVIIHTNSEHNPIQYSDASMNSKHL